MKFETYKCDQCGELKKESNHWYEIFEHPGASPPYLSLFPYRLEGGCERGEHLDFCGIECVQKYISKWMSEVS